MNETLILCIYTSFKAHPALSCWHSPLSILPTSHPKSRSPLESLSFKTYIYIYVEMKPGMRVFPSPLHLVFGGVRGHAEGCACLWHTFMRLCVLFINCLLNSEQSCQLPYASRCMPPCVCLPQVNTHEMLSTVIICSALRIVPVIQPY